MAFSSEQTWKLIANFANGSDIASAGANPPTSYIGEIPTLVAGDSGEVIFDCFEYYESVTSFLESGFSVGSTATLFLKEKDVIDSPVTLVVGAVAVNAETGLGVLYSRVSFAYEDDAISSYFAGKTCLLYAEIDDGVQRRTIQQTVAVTNKDGAALITQETKNIPISFETLTAVSNSITAYPGKIVYFLDASLNAVDVTLPAAAAYPSQEIVLLTIDDTNERTATGTVNGDAAGITMPAGENDGAHLFSDGAAWFNLNYLTVIT